MVYRALGRRVSGWHRAMECMAMLVRGERRDGRALLVAMSVPSMARMRCLDCWAW
jgi:hypothetical protein